RPAAVPREVDTRPLETGDRDTGQAVDLAGPEGGRGDRRFLLPGSPPPGGAGRAGHFWLQGSAAIVVAADVDQRRGKRVAQESEPGRLEVAAADDPVDRPERVAVDGMLEGRILLVRDRQEPDRSRVTLRKGAVVGPVDVDPADHGGASSGGSLRGSPSVRRLSAARISPCSSNWAASEPPWFPDAERGSRSMTSASMPSWPL